MTTAIAPAQAELTLTKARATYEAAMDDIRDCKGRGSWELAANHVVMGMAEWECVATLRYLMTQGGLAKPDTALAKALAARLGLEITFAEAKPLTKKSW